MVFFLKLLWIQPNTICQFESLGLMMNLNSHFYFGCSFLRSSASWMNSFDFLCTLLLGLRWVRGGLQGRTLTLLVLLRFWFIWLLRLAQSITYLEFFGIPCCSLFTLFLDSSIAIQWLFVCLSILGFLLGIWFQGFIAYGCILRSRFLYHLCVHLSHWFVLL